jgi:hypothetical protein
MSSLNISNPQACGQENLTFNREVLAGFFNDRLVRPVLVMIQKEESNYLSKTA